MNMVPFSLPFRATAASLLLLTACADATGPSVAAEVQIQAAPAEMIVGRRAPFGVTVKDASGGLVPDPDVHWYSSNPTVAVVSFDGEVSAVTPGFTTITAVAGTASATVAVSVVPVPISTIALDVAGGDVVVGGLRGAAVYAFDIDGTLVVDRQVEWTIADTTIATVRALSFATAEVVGRRGGQTTLTATLGGKSASARITVNGG